MSILSSSLTHPCLGLEQSKGPKRSTRGTGREGYVSAFPDKQLLRSVPGCGQLRHRQYLACSLTVETPEDPWNWVENAQIRLH